MDATLQIVVRFFSNWHPGFRDGIPNRWWIEPGQEDLVRSSDLDWTIFKPPRLTMNPSGDVTQQGARVRVGLLSAIARWDLARLLVDEAEQQQFNGQAVFVKGWRSWLRPATLPWPRFHSRATCALPVTFAQKSCEPNAHQLIKGRSSCLLKCSLKQPLWPSFPRGLEFRAACFPLW